MKKKLLLACMVAVFAGGNVSEQKSENFYGLGNRVGVGIGVGTEGIGIDVATCLTKYVSARVGVNFMPGITFHTDADVNVNGQALGNYSTTVEAKASLARTTFDVKFDCYPSPPIVLSS